MESEVEVLEIERRIRGRVKKQMEKNQRRSSTLNEANARRDPEGAGAQRGRAARSLDEGGTILKTLMEVANWLTQIVEHRKFEISSIS